MRSRAALGALALSLVPVLAGCPPPDGGRGNFQNGQDDGQVVPTTDFHDDPAVVSPPNLGKPIYECTDTVFVSDYIPDADVQVFVAGTTAPIGHGRSFSPSMSIKTSVTFTPGQIITAAQTSNGHTSGPSNVVKVRAVRDDYPNGLPKPRLDPPPLFRCGQATGARQVLPGAHLDFISEPKLPNNTFGPPVTIASMDGAGATQWMIVAPAFGLGDRVHAESRICGIKSPPSDPEIVQAEPPTLPLPNVDPNPSYVGQHLVVVRPIVNGAVLDVFANDLAHRIGGSPTPGGTGQMVEISPAPTGPGTMFATQSLCTRTPPGPPTTVKPCSELPPAKIKPPSPGDTQVEVTDWVPGSVINIYADGKPIGGGPAPIIILTQPLKDGQIIDAVQYMGPNCKSKWMYEIAVRCRASTDPMACSSDWPAFGHDSTRRGEQAKPSSLSDPTLLGTLKVRWTFKAPEPGHFRASPIVYKGIVYVGMGNTKGNDRGGPYRESDNGRLYAIDARSGRLIWQYPPAGKPPLISAYVCNPSSAGIAASASIARIRNEIDAVIFGAPDPSLPPGNGSGRIFALNAATGAEIWKSPAVAVLDGTNAGSIFERHEQIGYSSPLVRNDRVYVGIANHCDNPIQNGKVVALDLSSGSIVPGFAYQSTSSRGGGVWSAVAAGPTGELYITTGNARSGNPSPPAVNHALSMLRLDKNTGGVIWKLQPVPFDLDNDPDWAAGPIAVNTRCGTMVVSTQKDGWSYAVAAGGGVPGSPAMRWQFPAVGMPFVPGDGTVHSDDRYLVRGAAWKDTFITMTGGLNIVHGIGSGFGRLHGLDICAGSAGGVRWLFDVPSANIGQPYQLGPPTVTGGVVYVGTAQGHLIAFADPSVAPAAGLRCMNPAVPQGSCSSSGFPLVPQPAVLADVTLDGSRILTEPALADGRVFVATQGGNVFMLEP